MRKKVLSLLLISAMSVSLIACGGNSKKEESAPTAEEEALEEALMEVVGEDEEVERGEAVEEKEGYARSPKWDEIEQKYMAVQVQDYFFEIGMTVDDLHTMLEESGKDFIWSVTNIDGDHTYYPDKMMKSSTNGYASTLRIDIGQEVDIILINPYDYEIPYKDCVCVKFSTTLHSPDNYVFGYNGKNEILYKWTIDDIKGMMESGGMFEGFEIVSEDSNYV